MAEALHYEFMRNALIAGLLASVICGVIGTYVVVNRIVFLSGGIAHAAYGGIGIALFLGLPYALGTMGFALFAALVMAAITRKARHRSDTVIGVLWASGMALGVILIDLAPGYRVDAMSFLFGSILSVPPSELLAMAVATVLILAVVAFFYNELLAISYDEEFARLRGIPVGPLYFLLVAMIAVSVVLVIRIVGLILVIALLTIPPYIAERFVGSLAKMMILSTLLSALFTFAGIWLAYVLNLSSGAAIIMVASAGFFISLAAERLLRLGRAAGAGSAPT